MNDRPLDDPARLAALRESELLDAPSDGAFDHVARLARALTGAPVALVSLLDDARQWVVGQVGLPDPAAAAGGFPLSLCRRVVASGEALRVADARQDPALRDAAGSGVVACAGVPVVTAEGHRVGAVCVFDASPRAWTDGDVASLRDLAAAAAAQVDLRRAARRLRDSDARHRALVDTSAQAIWRFEVDAPIDASLPADAQVEAMFRVSYLAECNDALARMYGYERAADLFGARVTDMMPADEPSNVAYLRAFVESGYRLAEVASVEHDREGREKHFSNSLVGVVEGGHLVRAWGTQRDVTEATRTAAVLDRYRMLSEHGRDLILFVRPDGRIVEANAAAVAAYGYAREALLALSVRDLRVPEDHARLTAHLAEADAGGSLFETTHRRSDGTTFPVEVSARGADVGGERLVLSIARDISERRRAERDRAELLGRAEAARAEAERANRLKDDFLSTLSHELRTPLNAILGWARMLRGSQLPEARRDHALETIERNARVQARLVEDILDVSRIVSGKLPLTVDAVDPADLVRAAVDDVRPSAEARGLRLEATYGEGLGAVTADAGRLQQVVSNLLSNAVKFTPRGGRVGVRLRRDGDHVEIEVADTGQGIAAEFLPYVFERFRQADASSARQHGGLGLGLAIVRHLVEMHGGNVSVRSDGVGRGAAFAVRIPAAGVAVATGEFTAGAAPEGDAPFAGRHVLVVDDEADARDFVRVLLESRGARVSVAADAAEAYALLRGARPDVVVSDLGMPGEDGLSLIGRVRALGPDGGGTTPAVALTAYARTDDRARALAAGFTAYLTKPVELDDLVATIERVLRGSIVP